MASRGVNKVILVGNVGADPDTRYTKDNNPVVNLRLATTDSWFDRNSNERQERTEWHRVVFFGKLAETIDKYVSRGQKLYVEGRLQTRKWEDQRTGQDRYSTEVIGSEMVMLSSGGGADGGGYRGQRRQQSGGADEGGSWSKESSDSQMSADPIDDLGDDVPW